MDSKICGYCKQSFTWTQKRFRKAVWEKQRFCSVQCAGKGAPRTVATDEKVRFWGKVEKSERCWSWTGAKSPYGYGYFMNAAGKCEPAHRASYRLTFKDAGNLRVCHSCDNPECVRPDHLFLGTAHDNTQDMMRKGRGTVGSKGAAAKLNEQQVLEIRKDTRRQQDIAAAYGVTLNTISSIVTRRTWRHI